MDETAEAAARYWDENKEKSKDPAFWMAHTACRHAINRRVTGTYLEWPLDWFKRVHAPAGFQRGVSWGCGLGPFERSAVRIGLVREIDAFDVSPDSLDGARKEAAREGIEGIHYQLGNFDDPEVPEKPYDIAFFHASLHHVSALERLFRRLTLALKPGGAIYVDEYVGPSRHEWNPEHLRMAQAILDMVPPEAKLKTQIDLPIEVNDPSEAVRSSEIPKFLREFFDLHAYRPYGGQIVDLTMPCVSSEWASSPEGTRFVQAMLDLEDYELVTNPPSTHHLVAYGTLKSYPRLVQPLGKQVVRALARRTRALFAGER